MLRDRCESGLRFVLGVTTAWLLVLPSPAIGAAALDGGGTDGLLIEGNTDLLPEEPHLVGLADGSYLLAWRSNTLAGSLVQATRIAADGVPGPVLDVGRPGPYPERRAEEPTLAVARLADGGWGVFWGTGEEETCIAGRTYSRDDVPVSDLEPVACGERGAFGPDLAAAIDGSVSLVYLEGPGFWQDGTHTAVRLRRYGPDGGRLHEDDQLLVGEGFSPLGTQRWAAVANAALFGDVVAWAEAPALIPDVTLSYRRLAPDGGVYGLPGSLFDGRIAVALAARSDGAALLARSGDRRVPGLFVTLDRLGHPFRGAVLSRSPLVSYAAIDDTRRGGAVVAWSETADRTPSRIKVRVLDEMLGLMGPELDVGELPAPGEGEELAEPRENGRVAVAVSRDLGKSQALVLWEASAGGIFSLQGRLLDLPPGCDPTVAVACLLGSRFAATASWEDFDGHRGDGFVVGRGLSDDTAGFSFFGPDNWELILKVLDGCALNGHFWVLAAGATNVGYRLEVKRGDEAWSFENPVGRFAPAVIELEAFRCRPDDG